MSFDSQWRATKEDTKNNQESFRLLIEELEIDNRGVKSEERGHFFSLLADSLLGLDFDREYTIYLNDMKTLKIKNIGEFVRELVYQDSFVDKNFLKKYSYVTEESIEIKYIWHGLKFVLFGIYPGAINTAIKLSKERDNMNFDDKELASFGVTKGKKKKPSDSSWPKD